ncbi:MAG: UvrD-helicase domain-containing protein [Thermoguttaceae bacterium]|nr:UvrD-helicase domain-containing protein [Thermoguttaceae bacterium]
MSTDFLSSFAQLPRKIQSKVMDFIDKFQKNPKTTGMNYEKILNAADKRMCSVRIDDTYRGILAREEESGTYLLLWIDHHDEAYAWACRKRCAVNAYTGCIQVYEVEQGEKEDFKPQYSGYAVPYRLFQNVSDEDLLRLGVPQEQIILVRKIVSDEEFRTASAVFPRDAYEYLSYLADGVPTAEVLELAAADRAPQPTAQTFADALESPQNTRSFVVVEGEEELRRILSEPLEKWRVFLHPTQRKIVEKTFSGSTRVLGGAGTGKTVVALHRAKFLASKLTSGKILFTTFTANLAADIRENLRKICTPEEFERIEVINLDAWVREFLASRNYPAEVHYEDETLKAIWDEAFQEKPADLKLPKPFFKDEWARVAAAQEAFTLEKYAAANRAGRGTPLTQNRRQEVWKVFEAYQRLTNERNVRDINAAMTECREMVQSDPDFGKYAHVIVDEGQDFSPNAFRLLRALAGEEHENDLFIVGDSHQRIYRNHAVLSACGIAIRGRSSTLRINYRTTEETRKFAFALLQGIDFDDLDESPDEGKLCRSLLHGDRPTVKNFENADEEFQFLMTEILNLTEENVALENICLVARTHRLLEEYARRFTENGIPTYEITGVQSDDRACEGLRIATMHRVKGLEFQYVFVSAVNSRTIPLPAAIDRTDEKSRAETLTAEKCLLYVALTRAQKAAWITSFGEESEFLSVLK